MRTIAADHRSAFPHRAGVPSWGAVLIALTGTLVGLAIDAASGNGELGAPFASCFALGCIAAVLAVRQSGIFTAVVQPPLLLFVTVPLAYFLFHGSAFGGLKDIAINCGYPLIERFPLMLFTSAAVLLLGMTRWFLAMSPPGQAGDVEEGLGHGRAQPATSSVFSRLRGALGFLIVTCGSRPAVVAMSRSDSRPKRLIFPHIRSDMRGCVTPSRRAASACVSPVNLTHACNAIINSERARIAAVC
jgi:hypothetical protein